MVIRFMDHLHSAIKQDCLHVHLDLTSDLPFESQILISYSVGKCPVLEIMQMSSFYIILAGLIWELKGRNPCLK